MALSKKWKSWRELYRSHGSITWKHLAFQAPIPGLRVYSTQMQVRSNKIWWLSSVKYLRLYVKTCRSYYCTIPRNYPTGIRLVQFCWNDGASSHLPSIRPWGTKVLYKSLSDYYFQSNILLFGTFDKLTFMILSILSGNLLHYNNDNNFGTFIYRQFRNIIMSCEEPIYHIRCKCRIWWFTH